MTLLQSCAYMLSLVAMFMHNIEMAIYFLLLATYFKLEGSDKL